MEHIKLTHMIYGQGNLKQNDIINSMILLPISSTVQGDLTTVQGDLTTVQGGPADRQGGPADRSDLVKVCNFYIRRAPFRKT